METINEAAEIIPDFLLDIHTHLTAVCLDKSQSEVFRHSLHGFYDINIRVPGPMSHQAPVEEGRAATFQQRGGVVVCHRIIRSLGGEERGGEGGGAGG